MLFLNTSESPYTHTLSLSLSLTLTLTLVVSVLIFVLYSFSQLLLTNLLENPNLAQQKVPSVMTNANNT